MVPEQVGMFIVEPAMLTEEDLKLLQRPLAGDYTGHDLASVLELVTAKRALIWRLTTVETRAILVTQILSFPAGDELFIWLLGGRNLRGYTDYIIDRLMAFAKSQGCKWLRCLAVPGVAKHLKEKGLMKHRFECLIREID